MKNHRTLAHILTTLSIIFGLICPIHSAHAKHIAISQFVDHVALDAARSGVLDALKENGYFGLKDKVTIQNAQGNMATNAQIASHIISEKPDVIVTISTPSSQAIIGSKKQHNIPVVFSAVTDPYAAKLIQTDKPHPNVTGVLMKTPIVDVVTMMKHHFPDVKRIGIVYNPGEVNVTSVVADLKEALKVTPEISLIEAQASQTHEVVSSFQSIASNIDLLFVPMDNTVVAALNALVPKIKKAKIPSFSTDPTLVSQGIWMGLGYSLYEVGYESGAMAAEILRGKSPEEIPVRTPHTMQFGINLTVSESFGKTIDLESLPKLSRPVSIKEVR